MKIRRGTLVGLRYRLLDEGGEVVETSEDEQGGDVAEYRHGEGQLLPALERALEGSEPGASLRLTLPPEDAYGAYDPAGLCAVPRSELPPQVELRPGEWLTICIQRSPEDGPPPADEEDELEARVVEVAPHEVVLDLNHPLAGRTITFEVEVVSVQPVGGDGA